MHTARSSALACPGTAMFGAVYLHGLSPFHPEAELPIRQGGAAAPPTAGGSPYYPSLLPQVRQSSGVVAWSTTVAFSLGRCD
jgi:hypothetical protein